MKAATLFSGIGSPEVAMPHWEWIWHAEIETFPAAVMAARHPSSVNLGDVTADDFCERALACGRPDVLVFGSPCQSYSVAGKRLGLDDPRGNLALIALGIVDRLRPAWFVFENVPGLFSSYSGSDETAREVLEGPDDGGAECDEDSDFAAFVAAVSDIRYCGAWTVLDAQFAGLAQRRDRLFFVGCIGADWQRAAAVLLEPESLCGHPPARGEAREDVAGTLRSRTGGGCGPGPDDAAQGLLIAPEVANVLTHRMHKGINTTLDEGQTLIAHSLRADGFDASEDGTGRGTPIIPVQQNGTNIGFDLPSLRRGDGGFTSGVPAVAYAIGSHAGAADGDQTNRSHAAGGPVGLGISEEQAYALRGGRTQAIAFTAKDSGADAGELSPTLRSGGHHESHANGGVMPAIAFGWNKSASQTMRVDDDTAPGLQGSPTSNPAVLAPAAEWYNAADNASSQEAGPTEALRLLFSTVDQEAMVRWCFGILAPFWPQEVLRCEVYGQGLRREGVSFRGLVYLALSLEKNGPAGAMRTLWEAGCEGCPPPGWEFPEQQAVELAAHLSRLPQSPAPAQRFMHLVWSASEGLGLLREALSAVQEIRRSACDQGQPVRPDTAGGRVAPDAAVPDSELPEALPRARSVRPARSAGEAGNASGVRRLTTEECESLQGFLRSYTAITYRGKPAADGPRYKAIGNSMAVPVVRWILSRIEWLERNVTAGARDEALPLAEERMK